MILGMLALITETASSVRLVISRLTWSTGLGMGLAPLSVPPKVGLRIGGVGISPTSTQILTVAIGPCVDLSPRDVGVLTPVSALVLCSPLSMGLPRTTLPCPVSLTAA